MILFLALFPCGIGSPGGPSRDEIVSLRDSIRFMTVELHNIASILDGIISRNGGPAPPPPNQARDRRISEHLDQTAIENALRMLGASNARSNPHQFHAGHSSGPHTRLVNLGILTLEVDEIRGFAIAALSGLWALVLLCYDTLMCVVVRAVFAKLTSSLTDSHRAKQPARLPPGRSRSPIIEDDPSDWRHTPNPTRARSPVTRISASTILLGGFCAVLIHVASRVSHIYLVMLLYAFRLLAVVPMVLVYPELTLGESASAPVHPHTMEPPKFGT